MCKSHGFGSFFHESSRMILFVEKIESLKTFKNKVQIYDTVNSFAQIQFYT